MFGVKLPGIGGLTGGNGPYQPPVAFHFDVRLVDAAEAVDAVLGKFGLTAAVDGKFTEVSGLSVTSAPFEIKEGGVNNMVHVRPNTAKYSPLILKRGLVTISSALGLWCNEVMFGKPTYPILRKNILITLLNNHNKPVIAWSVIGAFPTKWEVSALNSSDNNVVFESIELAYDRFEQFAGLSNPISAGAGIAAKLKF
ncbi:MAG: phage tail protein [Cytophagaceae bacterium]|jgi:phage tail-like protein|nr:phage tail protein [Cytophagaceae bacterium]